MRQHFSIRLIAVHFLGLFSLVSCIGLAYWQWDRAQVYVPSEDSVTKTFDELSPLRDFLPASSVGVPTSVTGVWQPNERILMADRVSDGKSMISPDPDNEVFVTWDVPVGYWIVDILELPDASSLGVVRGFTQDPAQHELVTGTQLVAGVMQPGEDVPGLKLVNNIELLTTNMIVENSRIIAHDGYLVASSITDDLTLVSPIFSEPIIRDLNWQNVAYTFNWIFFAGIVVMMWFRVARDEIQFVQLAKFDAELVHDNES